MIALLDVALPIVVAYQSPDFVMQAEDLGKVLTVITLLGGVMAFIGRFAIIKPIKTEIAKQTRQIQPHTNGGLSLTDLHRKHVGLEQDVREIKTTQNAMQNQLDLIVDLLRGKERNNG